MTTTALHLTTGAADLLGQIAAAPGLLTKATDLYRVGQFAEDHLSDLPDRPARDERTEKEWIEALKAWERTTLAAIEAKPATVESLRTLVRAAVEKGSLPARPATTVLLRALGMVEDA